MRQFLVASGACVLPSGERAEKKPEAGEPTPGAGAGAGAPAASSPFSGVSGLQMRPPPDVPLDGLVVLTDIFCVPPLDWAVLLGAFFEELYESVEALRRALPAPCRRKGLGRVLLIGPGLNPAFAPRGYPDPGLESDSDDLEPDASGASFPLSNQRSRQDRAPDRLPGAFPGGLDTRDSVCLALFRSGLAGMARTLGQVFAREGLTVNLIDPRGPGSGPPVPPSHASPAFVCPASLTQPPEFETMTRGVSRGVSQGVSPTGAGGLSGSEPGPSSAVSPGYPAYESAYDRRAAALLSKNRRVTRALGIRDILDLTGYLLSPWSSSVTGAVFQPTQSGLVALAA